MGGDASAFGPILQQPDLLLDWEVRCHAMFAVLAVQKLVTTDGLRRAIEALTPDQYNTWTYYERWAAGMTTLLLEQKVLSSEELSDVLFGDANIDDATTTKPLFQTGDSVRVKAFREDTNMTWRRPHIRVPGYIYGVHGVVERVCGVHKDPSFLAFGCQAPNVRLYRVRFRMSDIWPENYNDESFSNYGDVIEAEVYEPWLETSTLPKGRDFENEVLFNHSSGNDCIPDLENSHPHSHHHHHHDGNDHSHHPRPFVEERAAMKEGEPRPGKDLYEGLSLLLIQKGIISAEEIRSMVERLEIAGQQLHGASLVVRAWIDPAFAERLVKDAPSAAAEIGIAASNPNAPTILTVVQNTRDIHNLVVCTLCSCYPSGLLGIAPSWYKSREYRSRAVREPRKVLREFGTTISSNKQIRVHDSTADHRYLVLPERPEGTEGWTEGQLRPLVTRDSMVGVTVPTTAGKDTQ